MNKMKRGMPDNTNANVPLFDIDTDHEGRRVWVTGSDGSNIGRFDKRSGIDIHRTVSEQMSEEAQSPCLYCTHGPATEQDWETFRSKIKEFYKIDIPKDTIKF
jgi:hypothetical protein